MQFIRRPVKDNSVLIVSVCRRCHEFVAAGTSEQYLAIAERMHHCVVRPSGAVANEPSPLEH
ncbi:MAG TPA: hypothetical protein VHN74_11690 [Candidatus Angelobacter sp.]|jgi:hypothetical protein|nr:hypothetical protein [Candidatus Angelobacter sp.]